MLLYMLIFVLLSPGNRSTHKAAGEAESILIDSGWEMRQADSDEWYPAEVPGCVHMDLLKNGLIAEPYYRDNEEKQQWIDKEDWVYRTSFSVPADMFQKDMLELNFDGLDTYADVFLNGTKLFSANNMFRTWPVDIKKVLAKGNNELVVYFHSPIKMAEPLWDSLGYPLPASNDDSEMGGVGNKKLSVFTRKAGYHYGWDWGPRFVTSGIWRPVYLNSWNGVKIENVQFIQESVSIHIAEIKSVVSIRASRRNATAIIISNKQTGEIYVSKVVRLRKGNNQIPLHFTISEPSLWWSNGLGQPHLYEIEVKLASDQVTLDRDIQNIGIRTIRLITEKDSMGESFYFELNGHPVFMKGANYIPNDVFINRVSDEKMESIIKAAADANMNMLRVWGGGIYENERFYDLCDEYGILIWQDFMFACSMYPGDYDFLASVEAEVRENLIRLRNHPSIALWCGNNELEWAWFGWGLNRKFKWSETDSTRIRSDYIRLFEEIIPATVALYDDRDYWPSSPSFRSYGPHLDRQGDRHLWDVWKGSRPWTLYLNKVPRFMSEFGYQSYPEMSTISTFALPEEQKLDSRVMQLHQKARNGNQRINNGVSREFGDWTSFPDYVYLTQLYQAYDVRFGAETHRRNMPHCMGTLYWQLNDCWPVASWAGIDYEGRWKALHYAIRDIYKPIIVSIVNDEEMIKVFAVSDLLTETKARLSVQLLKFNGEILYSDSLPIIIPQQTSQVYFSIDKKRLLSNTEQDEIVMLARLSSPDNQTIHENTLYFGRNRELKLSRNFNLKKSVTKNKDGTYSISLSTDVLIRGIFLSTPGQTDFFSDNYFDLIPGKPKTIRWVPGSGNADIGLLTIKTLNEVLNG